MDRIKELALQLASKLPLVQGVDDLLIAAKEIEKYLRTS